jgi:hypothetical protein
MNRNILNIEQKVKQLSHKSRTIGSIHLLFAAIVSDDTEYRQMCGNDYAA